MITLECNYAKKLGLPQYSSHQFSITLKTELADLTQVQAESGRLYKLLQSAVDGSIQEVGFLPANGNGNGNGHPTNGSGPAAHGNGNGHGHSANGHGNGRADAWACSDKQKELILKVVEENRLDKKEIEHLAQERFSKSVRALNKLEASGLIDELLEKYGGKNGRGMTPRPQRAGAR